MAIADTITTMEAERVKRGYERKLLDSAQENKETEERKLAYFDIEDAQPTTFESVGSALSNIPIKREAVNVWNTFFMDRDPSFDPVPHVQEAANQIGMINASKLYDTASQEEFDYMLNDLKEQQQNQLRASTTYSGQIAGIGGSLLSAENLLFTAATGGAGLWGTVAKSAKAGILANTYKGAVAGGASSYIGADIDADNMIGFSHEDLGWATLLGTTFGAGYTRFAGRVYEPMHATEGTKLYSFGGAFGDSMKAVYDRAIGKGMKQYNGMHSAKAQDTAELRESIATKRTGIFRETIDDMAFDRILEKDVDFGVELDDWVNRNSIAERENNRTKAEEFYDQATVLRSEYAKLRNSNSKTAQVLNYNMYESGTSSVVKNNSASIVMERLQQTTSNMYVPEVRNHFQAYYNRNYSGNGFFDKTKNYFKARKEFNEEVVLYMNARRNGYASELQEVSSEVKALADKLDEANLYIFNKAQGAGVGGFDEITYKKGFLHQRHERAYYKKAKHDFGEKAVVDLVQAALQSKRGAGIQDSTKAARMAKAFVDRFTDTAQDIRAGSVMDDDAWEVLQNIFKDEGMDFDGKDIKAIFNEATQTKAADAGRTRYAKDRVPLDLTVTNGDLRMMDLMNTDVENLTSSYAMSMSGHIAMAQKGIKDRNTWNRLKKRVVEEDPELEQAMDDLHQTFTTGRTAGGVSDRRVALAMKSAVLAMLNNLGLTQLTESGTAMATYGIGQFFSTGNEAMKSMWKGRKNTASTQLADEIMDSLFPLGKEHIAMPPHLNQELQSNSKLATATMLDKADTAVNMGLTLQGYTSLFNQARSTQHHIAFGGLVHKIGRYINEGKLLDEQLASIGFSEDLFDGVKNSIKKHGKLTPEGKVDILGFEKWDDAVKEEFTNIIVRNQSSIVQKAMAGESTAWMSKDFGALLIQFRKFPVESVRKQLLRKHSIGNEHLAASMALNTVVAGTVITAGNYLKQNNTEKDLENALKFGLVYNADLGSVASIWDLGISLTGAPEAMHVNPYAHYGTGVLSIPALNTINGWSNLGTLPLDALDGDLDADTLRSVRMLPIVGNHIALSWAQR